MSLALFASLLYNGGAIDTPDNTKCDLADSEMARNVVYPLKLFNSMFLNKAMLLWLYYFSLEMRRCGMD